MKKALMGLFAAVCLLVLPSCEVKHADVVKAIKVGVKVAIELGFSEWKKKDPKAVQETSIALNKTIKETIRPWILGNGTVQTSAMVQEFLNSSLVKNLNPEAKVAIVAASAILDIYLPVPSVNEKLTQEQVDYIVAFLDGVESGTQSFINTTKDFKGPIWIK